MPGGRGIKGTRMDGSCGGGGGGGHHPAAGRSPDAAAATSYIYMVARGGACVFFRGTARVIREFSNLSRRVARATRMHRRRRAITGTVHTLHPLTARETNAFLRFFIIFVFPYRARIVAGRA